MRTKVVISSFLLWALCPSLYAKPVDVSMQNDVVKGIQEELLTTLKNEVTPVISAKEVSPAIQQLIAEIKKEEPNYDVIDMILRSGNVDFDEKDEMGYSALMWSVGLGKRYIAQRLFWKSNLDLQNNEGETALIMAISKGRREIIDDMLNNILNKYNNISIDLNIQDGIGYNALAYAIQRNDKKTVQQLLSVKNSEGKYAVTLNPKDLKKRYGKGNSPLIDSVKHEDGEIFEMIFNAKDENGNYRADVNYVSDLGWTVLSMATGKPSTYVYNYPFVEKILEAKDNTGNYRMTNFDGRRLTENPLFQAVTYKNLENVKLLTQAKDRNGKCRVDFNVTIDEDISHLGIKQGDTALDMAIKMKQEEIAQVLLSAMMECKK